MANEPNQDNATDLTNSGQTEGVASDEVKAETKGDGSRRKIAGNLPYTSSIGPLIRVLEKIPVSEKPDIFSPAFMETVMGVSGGASRPVIPILKAVNFLNQSAAPTELYSQFQTEGGRSLSALEALKKGFAEIFRRNQFAHKATEEAIRDIVVGITGLPKSEAIVRYIINTFVAFQKYAKLSTEAAPKSNIDPIEGEQLKHSHDSSRSNGSLGQIGLVYNINIVLPETTNVEVYNAIFRSLKGNMLV